MRLNCGYYRSSLCADLQLLREHFANGAPRLHERSSPHPDSLFPHLLDEPKMSSESENSQNETLNALRKERKRVAVFLVNGIKLVGHIESFDQYVVMLSSAGGTQAVYKHGISTVQEDTGKSLRPLDPRNGSSTRRGVGPQTEGDSLSKWPHGAGMDQV